MEKPSSEDGPAQARDQVAAALRLCGDDIRRQWKGRVQQELGLADDQVERLLGEDVGQVVEETARIIETRTAQSREPRPPGDNANLLASPDQMLMAYRLLRQAGIEQVASQLGRDLHTDELAAICDAIDAVMARRLAGAVQQPLEDLRIEADMQARTMSFLSHDLRGSLNGAVLMLEVLRRELQRHPELSQSMEDLSLVSSSVQEIITLLERHSQLCRLQQGRAEAQPLPIQLKNLIEEVAGQFSKAAQAKGNDFVIDIPADAVVHADRALLATAIANLLDNAVKYASRGLVTLTARPDTAAPKPTWALSITDSGPGIKPQRLEILMDAPRRLELKEQGLGLIIVQYAIRPFGGQLQAESTPDHGSTFRLLLPAA
jgi:signal transduction histidine kinase